MNKSKRRIALEEFLTEFFTMHREKNGKDKVPKFLGTHALPDSKYIFGYRGDTVVVYGPHELKPEMKFSFDPLVCDEKLAALRINDIINTFEQTKGIKC